MKSLFTYTEHFTQIDREVMEIWKTASKLDIDVFLISEMLYQGTDSVTWQECESVLSCWKRLDWTGQGVEQA